MASPAKTFKALSKRVATTIVCTDGLTTVTYHRTPVIQVDSKKRTIKLDNGGYRTTTTKSRINDTLSILGLPFRVYQHKHSWFIGSLGVENGACLDTPWNSETLEISY